MPGRAVIPGREESIMKFKYSDYCTVFYVPADETVYIYDEIEDRGLQQIHVESESQAVEVMRSWVEQAPEGIIAEII